MAPQLTDGWQEFLAGPLYSDAEVPWRDDPAYALLLQFSGLRDSVGGQVAPALTQAIGLVQALARVDLLGLVRQQRPAYGLSLGFGMNLREPYDLLQTFELDAVHGYEWIGEHVVEAARSLQVLRTSVPDLATRIRLHHETMSDLSALATGAIRVVYVANVFNPEIPMAPDTFAAIVREVLRVLEPTGVLISRGSSGVLEEALMPHGRMLLRNPLVSVFQKGMGNVS
jgi:hypothetical protein